MPNFLFIGPAKSGSTWLYQALKQHNQVFLPSVKELFFFDRFYTKGWAWYSSYFSDVGERHRVIGEICHDYLFSPQACERIAHDLSSVKLMICLREPCDRVFSEFLYRAKVGLLSCDFETALKTIPDLLEHSCYTQPLNLYFSRFKREQIFVSVFDDLVINPQNFFDGLCDFLEIEHVTLSTRLRQKALPAARPRFRQVAKLARRISWTVRQWGFPGLVGRIKETPILSRILYRPYATDEKPQMSPTMREHLREMFTPEIQRLDSLLGTDLSGRWGYTERKKSESLDDRPQSLAVQAASQSDFS